MATTISRLEVELVLDDKNFQAKVRGTRSALKAFTTAIGKADTKVKRHEKNVRGLGTAFRHTIVTFGLMRDAIRTAWRLSGGLVQGIVNVNAEFERLNVLLRGMSKGVTAIEKATDAAKQFNQVIALAKAAPFTVQELTRSWVKFKSVGIDPATGSLNALVDAVAAFGGTSDILQRASIAVQQMAGKGVISMEELRQQMGEAVPQAMVLLARGMNLSVGDMVDAISRGAVVARPALAKLFAEFDLTFGGAAVDLMETYIGSLARLATVWQLTLKELGEASGLFEAVKSEVKLLIEQLDDPAVRRFGIDIATGMVRGFRLLVNAIRESVKWLREHAAMVWKVIAAWGAFKAVGILRTLVLTNVAIKSLTKSISLLSLLGFSKMVGNTAKATAAMKVMKISIRGIGVAMKAVPILGWVFTIGAIVAAIWGWFRASESLNDSQETGIDLVRQYGEAAEQTSKDLAKVEIAAMQLVLARRDTVLTAMKAALEAAKKLGEGGVKEIEDAIAKEEALVAISRGNLKKQSDIVNEAITGAARRAADTAKREMMAIFRVGLEEARNFTRDADAEINKLFDEAQIDAKERLEQRQALWKGFQIKQVEFAAQKMREQHALIIEAQNVLRHATEQSDIDEWNVKLATAKAAIAQIAATASDENARIASDLANMAAPTVFMDAAKKALAGYATSLDKIIGNSAGKIASLNAEMFDGMKETEKFIAKVSSGKIFGDIADWTEPMIAGFNKIIPLLMEIDRLSDEVKQKRSFESAMKAAQKTLAAATEEALIFAEAVDSGLNEVTGKRGRRFRTMMAGIIVQYGEATARAKKLLEVQRQLLEVGQDIDTSKRILDTRKKIEELDIAAIQNARERFAAEQILFDQQFKTFLLENAQADNIRELTVLYEELREKREASFEDSTPMKRMLKEWQDTMGAMEQAQANWMNSFVDMIVDGVAEGKLAFADFVKAVLQDLLKILLRALIVRAVLAAFGSAGSVELGDSLLGDGGGAFGLTKDFAKGGIMGPNGSINSYARGGIATKPQIAIFGEGDENEAFVPLPDGRSIPVSISGGGRKTAPDVTVNVINETGLPVEAEQDGLGEFDGETYVLDVVLKAASRPGGFRDGIRQATG